MNTRIPPLPEDPLTEAPRHRGGQPGNRNAVRHGYYTKKFNRADLKAYNACQFTGLDEEIALLRLFIRRVVEMGVTTDQFDQSLAMLRALSLALTSLNRLVKTQLLLPTGVDEIGQAIRDVYEELTGLSATDGTPLSPVSRPPYRTPDLDADLDQGFSFGLNPDDAGT